MTNKEFYKKEIEEIVYNEGDSVAVLRNGQITACERAGECDNCIFNPDCEVNRAGWFKQEHIEQPSVDWSKVPVDTKILVNSVEGDFGWIPRHFAKYENGKVYAFIDGATSWSTNGNINGWKFAKLADDEQLKYHSDSTQSSETNENTVDGKMFDEVQNAYQRGFNEAEAIIKELVDFYIYNNQLTINDVFEKPAATSVIILSCYSLSEIHKRISDYKSRGNVNGE